MSLYTELLIANELFIKKCFNIFEDKSVAKLANFKIDSNIC